MMTCPSTLAGQCLPWRQYRVIMVLVLLVAVVLMLDRWRLEVRADE